MQMGIGRLGSPNIILKRKFRFTLAIDTPVGVIPHHYVKVASRPKLDIEETEINFLNGVTWVPGKGKWQDLSVTYIDVPDPDMQSLYSWISTVYDFTNPVDLRQSEKAGWAGVAYLTMYDGCGSPLEHWVLQSCWPKSINFGDLDYSSNEESTVELTLRYSEVTYQSTCGPNPRPLCRGCNS